MSEALFSLVSGEGDGAVLGAAAGDTAGGAWELGYSAITQQVTVLAYQLIADGRLHERRVVEGLRELDGSNDEQSVYRAETPEFRSWLNGAAQGSPSPGQDPTLDPVGRSTILGVAYRRDPKLLFREAIKLNRMFHRDAESILCGVIVASAVAASCFGQAGRDMIKGVAEAVDPAVGELSDIDGLIGADRLSGTRQRIEGLIDGYGIKGAREALTFVEAAPTPGPLDRTLAALLIGAPSVDKAHEPVAEAVKIGGSSMGAGIGGLIGARLGIRAWPWAFANDTWFAEIGRRLVRGPSEVMDLPIPYSVEQHLNSGTGGEIAGGDPEIAGGDPGAIGADG
jgi:ADP-ribosylglycohydrolase